MVKNTFSIVYQITQECPFDCPFCLRLYQPRAATLGPDERREMVDFLKKHGLRRLTLTGGEPMILGDELFDFMKYIHSHQIHVCLSSTGFRLEKARLREMDRYVDQLLMSIHSLNADEWQQDFGGSRHAPELFETALNILEWVKATRIILEINTVVHRENIHTMQDLGWQLLSMNPNLVWRLDEYYGTGKEIDQRDRFELEPGQFIQFREEITNMFGHRFRRLRLREQESRAISPDLMISPSGGMVTSSDHTYELTEFNALRGPLPPQFRTFHPWAEYQKACRDWGWDRD